MPMKVAFHAVGAYTLRILAKGFAVYESPYKLTLSIQGLRIFSTARTTIYPLAT
jgi:hypothetical protein